MESHPEPEPRWQRAADPTGSARSRRRGGPAETHAAPDAGAATPAIARSAPGGGGRALRLRWYRRLLRPAAATPLWEFLAWPLLHYLLCELGLLWRDRAGGVSPVWPAAGVALIAAIRLGAPVLPLLAAGKILAALNSGYPLALALASNLGDPLKAVAGAAAWFGLRDGLGPRRQSARREVLRGVLACLALGFVGAAVGCSSILVWGFDLQAHDFVTWWIGDFLGALTVGAFFTQVPGMLRRTEWRWWLGLGGLLAAVVGASSFLFANLEVALQFGFLILPLLYWGATRYGLPGGAMLNLAFGISALTALGPNAHDHRLFVVALLGIGVSGGLACAALTEDLRAREKQSRRAAALWRVAHDNAQLQERQFRLLFDDLPDAILLHREAAVLHLNRAAQRIRERLGSAANRELWDRVRWQPAGECSTPGQRGAIHTLSTETGEKLHLEIRRSKILWHGQSTGLMVFRDCTEQQAAEWRLRESERRFSRFFQLNPGACVIVERETARIVEINESFERLFLVRRDEAVGQTVGAVGFWLNLEDRRKLVEAVAARGEVRQMRQHMRRRDGTVIVVEFSTREIKWDGVSVLFSILTDITDRTCIEEELRSSEERYRLMLENLHDVVIETDERGRCLYASSNLARVLGLPLCEVEGRPFAALLHPEDEAAWERHVARGDTVPLRLRARTARDRWLPVECTCRLVQTSGGARRNVITVYDISAQIRAEAERGALEAQLRQAQKLEAIGTLAGGIAHDFNNVLTSIMGHAQLAELEPEAAGAVRPHLHEILGASRRARDLVAKILTFSRKTEPKLEPLLLSTAIREVAGLIRAAMPANISLSLDLADDESAVICDPTQIHQVLLNLCTNSIHAMRGQGGVLHLGLQRVPPGSAIPDPPPGAGKGFMQMTVRDTGCGMSEEVLARIFEPFFTTKPANEGTGLGLSVVHGIVQAHGGRVTVRSHVGEGTQFDLLLPIPAQLPAAPDTRIADTPPLPRGHGEVVWVIDDESAIVSLLSLLLRSLGYEVRGFSDPTLANALIRTGRQTADAILCDFSMPQMSGIDLAEAHAGDGLPFVLMSGLIGSEESARARRAGVSRILTKPLDVATVAHTLAELLDGRRPPKPPAGRSRFDPQESPSASPPR